MKQKSALSMAYLMMVLILSSWHVSGRLYSCWMLLPCLWEFFSCASNWREAWGTPGDLCWRITSPSSALTSSTKREVWRWYHHCLAGFSLWPEMWSLILSIFLKVLSIIALLEVVGCLFGSHLLDVVVDVAAESVFFSNTYRNMMWLHLVRCNHNVERTCNGNVRTYKE